MINYRQTGLWQSSAPLDQLIEDGAARQAVVEGGHAFQMDAHLVACLVRLPGDDRRGDDAVIVEQDVGDVTRIGADRRCGA